MIFSKTKKLEERLKVEVPGLVKQLGETDYTKMFYKYYLSLFLYSNTHKVLVNRLMELLLLEGEDFVTYLIVRIAKEREQELLKLPAAQLEGRLRNDLFRSYFFKTTDTEALRLLQGLMIWRTDCTV